MIEIIGQGDNNYHEKFETREEAENYLVELVNKKHRYYSEYYDTDESDFSFDCEDDIIIWRENGKEKVCAGWHWSNRSEEPQIMIPLYRVMSILE